MSNICHKRVRPAVRRACYRLFVSFVLFGAVVDHGDVDSVGVAVDIEGQHESDGGGPVGVVQVGGALHTSFGIYFATGNGGLLYQVVDFQSPVLVTAAEGEQQSAITVQQLVECVLFLHTIITYFEGEKLQKQPKKSQIPNRLDRFMIRLFFILYSFFLYFCNSFLNHHIDAKY